MQRYGDSTTPKTEGLAIRHRLLSTLIAGLLSASALTARAGEPVYFECDYRSSPARPEAETTARVMVDRDSWRVGWVEPGPSGWLERAFYDIVTMTPQEVVARAAKAGEPRFLRLDLSSGDWSLTIPLDRSQNPNVWDPMGQRMGYPESVQLYTETGGTCVRVEPE